MAIDTTVTLRRLIAELFEWSEAHPMVNDYGYGQYLETYRSSGNKYLALVFNSPTATSENFFINYQWEVICLDYVLDEKKNQNQVLSDTQQVLRDLENTIRYSRRWKEFSRSDGTWNHRQVNEFGADKCFGWIATFTLKVKKEHGVCAIKSLMPTYDFETGQVVFPSCDPVTFAINGTSEDSFASGSEFDLTLVDTDGNTPVYTYDDVLKKLTVPAPGGPTSIDIDINGQPFLTDQSTDVDINVHDSVGSDVGSKIGSDWVIADALNFFNGSPISGVKAEGNKTIAVFNSNDDNVGTVVANSVDELEIEIANSTVSNSDDSYTASVLAEGGLDLPDITVTDSDGSTYAHPAVQNVTCTLSLNTANPFKTGQTTSYTTGDDGALERGNGVDFLTLSHNNYFGNTNRFTDELGGQTYTSNIVVDWSTWNQITGDVIFWHRTPQAAALWGTALAAQPYTADVYNDWMIPNIVELRSLYKFEGTQAMNYAPFNISVSGSSQNLWSSTTTPNATTTALAFNGVVIEQARAKASIACSFILMRYGNISEL